MTPLPGTPATLSAQRLSQTEFIALIAMLFATIAFSIDSMLPALPEIAQELTPGNVNAAQLIITSFVLGMGVGTLFAGPISDTFGRKPVIICGAILFAAGAAAAWAAPTLETLLIARVVQGLGVAAPRIVSIAMVRDMFSGREMARVVSFAMMVFMLVPAVAPAAGAVIINAFGWRSLFIAFVVFSIISCLWLGLRQPETLLHDQRRPLSLAGLAAAARETLSHRVIVVSILVQAVILGGLFGTLSSTQQIFDVTFGLADSFPAWFAVIALLAGSANIVNARLVVRLGMRWLVTRALAAQVILSVASAAMMGLGLWPDALAFPAYLFWTISVFFMTGLTMGNLNALALEPVGHIAGMAASLVGSFSTVAAVVLAVPIGLAFDGTPVPLMIAVSVLSALGWILMRLVSSPLRPGVAPGANS
jgi:DHA1 family bicyclomycin/chloramphenicol resistance-like MFS transporter